MPGHYSPNVQTRKHLHHLLLQLHHEYHLACQKMLAIKPFVPPTMTRSAYVANNIQPTASIKAINTSTAKTSSSSSSDVSVKTVDRTIPIDVCSLNINDHPLLLLITINGQTFYGLPDTGASSSCLDPLLPALFGLTITPVKGKVKNADVRVVSDRIGI